MQGDGLLTGGIQGRMRKLSRRTLLRMGAGIGLAGRLVASRAAAQPWSLQSTSPVLNDASRLNPVSVARHVPVRASEEQNLIAELRKVLRDAAREGLPVCVGGARHSMGGQSLPRGGVALSLAAPSCEPDTATRTYRVRGGMRWYDVIRRLDPLGFSVAVMQSNNDFSAAGTLSVNAHGWPVPYGPFGATVRAFRLMLADGTIMSCSRSENEELFRLAIGGYGLFGVVLDADVAMVPNVELLPTFELQSSGQIAEKFITAARAPSVQLAYGRLSVARERFLQDGLVVSYKPMPVQRNPLPPPGQSAVYAFVSRKLFRAQIGSDRGKRARWLAETMVLPRAAATHPVTRNTLLNYSVSVLAETDPRRTDILHEYFLPPERFGEFLAACRDLILESGQDLLNVTLRFVERDATSVLSYAPAQRIAAVLLFSQAPTPDADRGMSALTERLIDAVLALGGSFYLPYRLHARPDQVRVAYSRLD